MENHGKVYLVGAGPGDPGLLTLRARQCLEEADVVVYDYLANRTFLDYAPERAERIYVGKKGGCHTMDQGDINRLIVDKAGQGCRVVRLKGGDPFLFGRGGEEAGELAEAGVAFEVVPGVSSAIAVPAYAGIPLTHRDYTSSVSIITGHEDTTKETSTIDWEALAKGAGTLVFLMGVGNLSHIAENLMAQGRSPQTPTAVIQRGTVPEQRTLVAPLHAVAQRVLESGMGPPAVIVVGEVVALRGSLNWFETRPLFGTRILVTRARNQASGFLENLASLGASCVEFPTIEIVPPESWGPLDNALSALGSYSWVIFTSVNGVKHFFERLSFLGRDARSLQGLGVGAIGPKTAEELERRGIRPDLVPKEYRAEAVVEAFREKDVQGLRILLPRAALARDVLPLELEKMGSCVQVVDAYRTVKPATRTAEVKHLLETGDLDMVTFTSSSTVANFTAMFGEDVPLLHRWMEGVSVACIGPITARTAEEYGFTVQLISPEYTIAGLTRAIMEYYTARRQDAPKTP